MEAADKRHGTGYVNITVKDGRHSSVSSSVFEITVPEFANVQCIEHPVTGREL